ncbi:MAG: cob(I)yrinic acid a,c-diamide adenosyltransferase [bacterium]
MVKLTKIYTKTGDTGMTGLVGGERIAKTSQRIAAIGAVDETNAAIGMARALLPQDGILFPLLRHIQNDLFDLGADLATLGDDPAALRLCSSQIDWLEQKIDQINDRLSALTSFILPAGGPSSSTLHFARAVARRAECEIWRLADEKAMNPALPTYANRLSDFLFVAARLVAKGDCGDELWQPGLNRS